MARHESLGAIMKNQNPIAITEEEGLKYVMNG